MSDPGRQGLELQSIKMTDGLQKFLSLFKYNNNKKLVKFGKYLVNATTA